MWSVCGFGVLSCCFVCWFDCRCSRSPHPTTHSNCYSTLHTPAGDNFVGVQFEQFSYCFFMRSFAFSRVDAHMARIEAYLLILQSIAKFVKNHLTKLETKLAKHFYNWIPISNRSLKCNFMRPSLFFLSCKKYAECAFSLALLLCDSHVWWLIPVN